MDKWDQLSALELYTTRTNRAMYSQIVEEAASVAYEKLREKAAKEAADIGTTYAPKGCEKPRDQSNDGATVVQVDAEDPAMLESLIAESSRKVEDELNGEIESKFDELGISVFGKDLEPPSEGDVNSDGIYNSASDIGEKLVQSNKCTSKRWFSIRNGKALLDVRSVLSNLNLNLSQKVSRDRLSKVKCMTSADGYVASEAPEDDMLLSPGCFIAVMFEDDRTKLFRFYIGRIDGIINRSTTPVTIYKKPVLLSKAKEFNIALWWMMEAETVDFYSFNPLAIHYQFCPNAKENVNEIQVVKALILCSPCMTLIDKVKSVYEINAEDLSTIQQRVYLENMKLSVHLEGDAYKQATKNITDAIKEGDYIFFQLSGSAPDAMYGSQKRGSSSSRGSLRTLSTYDISFTRNKKK